MICTLMFVALLASSKPQPQQAAIAITLVPGEGQGSDSHGNIAGVVSNVNGPERYKVVIYALTNRWYIQPTVKDRFTDIDKRGHWSNATHLGYRYAAILVRLPFEPPSATDSLPAVGGAVLARAEVPAKK